MAKMRLPDRRISYVWTIAISTLVCTPIFVVGRLLSLDFDKSFGIFSILISFVFQYVMERHNIRRQRKHVRFLSFEHRPYVADIFTGLKTELAQTGLDWKIDEAIVPAATSGSSGLGSAVRSAAAEGVDGLVILPLVVDDSYWTAVNDALGVGIEVVVLDVEPPRALFGGTGTTRPFHVATDYAEGGRLLGGLLVDQLRRDTTATAVLAFGPDQFFAGSERSRQALGELASAGFLDRTKLLPISEWDMKEDVIERLCEIVAAAESTVWVYVAIDANVRPVYDRLVQTGLDMTRVRLVGYDGIRTSLNKIEVLESGLATATIDVHTAEQGREAARILIDVRREAERRGPMQRLVLPTREPTPPTGS